MEKKVRNLRYVFYPREVAVVGASRNPMKIGHTVFRNFVEGGFEGEVYPVNPNAKEILGKKTYPNLSSIPGDVDCVVVAIPAEKVPGVISEAADLGIPSAVVISGGFSEVGRTDLEKEIKKTAEDSQMALIGPNCMGVLNPESRVDSIFLPMYKLERPMVGGVSFISQSGAIGGIIVDLAARTGIGMAKFVSYGNATVINEVHLLEYLARDPKTEKVALYLESAREGKTLLKVAKRMSRKKPLVVLKGGKTKRGSSAAKSHTGKMAGEYEVYQAFFRQANVVEAKTLDELFNLAKAPFEKKAGSRVAIVTNGGGMGVLAADACEELGLSLAEFSEETLKNLREKLPDYAVVGNPLDLVGDADAGRYETAIHEVLRDPGVDAMLVITLFQTVSLDSRVVSVIVRAAQGTRKPVLLVAAGGEYTELHRRILDSYGVPTYSDPKEALSALAKVVEYQRRKAF